MHSLLRFQNALARPVVPLLTKLGARIELDHRQRPVAVEGNHSVVFRLVRDGGSPLALRLPLAEPGAAEWSIRYGALAGSGLMGMRQRIASHFEVHRHAVAVAGEQGSDVDRLTALVTDWIEGPTLLAAADRAARAGNVQILRALAGGVRDLANALRTSGFVHGDITATNLIVNTAGQLTLIDLDTASWPGSPLGTTGAGSPGYRHPQGVASTSIRDEFPLLVLYTTLMALAENPDRRRSWGDSVSTPDGVLLFTDWDLGAPDTSESMRDAVRSSGRDVARLVNALMRTLHDGPESIAQHIGVIPGLSPRYEAPSIVEAANSTWDLKAVVNRMRTQFDSGDAPQPVVSPPTGPMDPADWTRPQPEMPAAPNTVDVAQLRVEFRRAIKDRREADVARLWAELAKDPVAQTMGLEMQAMYAAIFAERIEREHRQRRDEMVLSIAAEAKQRSIPLVREARVMVRQAHERLEVRSKLEHALATNSREDLADLAVSGQLVVLGDTDRQSLVRVLRAMEWPILQRALETDDDRLILDAYDEELFGEQDAVPRAVAARVGLARRRLKWADSVRASLRQRLAGDLVALFDGVPDRAELHLSASERRRAHRIVEQQRALRQLAEAIHTGDESEIVSALSTVERVGARLGEHFPWHAIRDVLERVSLIEDLIEAANATPVDYVRLAQLIPAARALGLEHDERLSGEYSLEAMQQRVIRAAHLRRVRMAIERGDDFSIVAAAVPDVYDVLEFLTEPERDRVAEAIRSQRRRDRAAVAALFEG